MDEITIERETLELAASLIQPLTGKGDREVYDALRAALAQKAEPDEQEVALQEIAEFGQDQLREPRTQEEKEQYAFEDWLASECPSGDVESVQRQWEESAEYLELQDATPAQPADIANPISQQEPVAMVFQHGATVRLDWASVKAAHNCKPGPLYAAPPAQPAEPVQRLSDERAAFEAWHNEYRTQELVRRDDTYYNTHVRCRWEGWQARAIESALQPGWRDIESAPKDGSSYLVADAERGFVAPHIRGVIHNNPGTNWDWQYGEAVTHWMPLPPAPKATK